MEPILKRSITRILCIAGIVACLIWYWYDHKKDHPYVPLVELIPFVLALVASIEKYVPQIAGIWRYEVEASGTHFAHAGRCELSQDGALIKIDGHRYVMMSGDGASAKPQQGDWCWQSTWGLVSADDSLRFDYEITIDDGKVTDHISALCKVNLQKGGRKMSGSYHTIPYGYGPSTTKWGTVTFWKLEGAEAVLEPPINGYDEKGNEKK